MSTSSRWALRGAVLLGGCSEQQPQTCHLPAEAPHVVQLVANDQVAFARYSDGSLFCWGDNALSAGCIPAPNALFHAERLPYDCLLDVAADAAGVGLVGDRRYVVWGETEEYPHSGVFLAGGEIRQLAPSANGILLLDDAGDVWHQGQLCFAPDDTQACVHHRFWTKLAYSSPALQVVGDLHVACAVLDSGKVECLGFLPDNELADKFGLPRGSLLTRPTELPIDGHVVEFRLEQFNGFARLDSGVIVAAGKNSAGELGVPIKEVHERATFDVVPGLPPAAALYSTELGGCMQMSGGDIWCWGGNQWRTQTAPERVLAPPVEPRFVSVGFDLCVSDGSEDVYCLNGSTTCSTKSDQWDLLNFKTCPFTN